MLNKQEETIRVMREESGKTRQTVREESEKTRVELGTKINSAENDIAGKIAGKIDLLRSNTFGSKMVKFRFSTSLKNFLLNLSLMNSD